VKLDLRFIVPGPIGRTVLIDADGHLPATTIERDDNEATIVGVDAVLRDRWAFRSPVLETHPRWADVPDGDPIPTLVTTEQAAADWMPPDGLAFGPIPLAPQALPPVLVPRAIEWLVELRTGSAPPTLRSRWARPGWRARASEWMRAALEVAGRPLLDEPRPFYLRGISAFLRGPTAAGDVFLKAVFPPFHPEPVATRLLAERFPGTVPNVIAVDADEGWLLIDDLAAPWVGELPAGERTAGLRAGAQALVDLQRALVDELAPFVAAGCPDRPLVGLADLLDAALGPDGLAVVEGRVSGERRERAVKATRRAIDRVNGLGFPDTLVHGDFHAGNVALKSGRAVIIDWSDAAIANPLIDLVTWLAWSNGEPDQQQAAIDTWIDAWAGPTDPVAVRERLDDILIVGAAYQIVSYDGIVRALEPATRYTMSNGANEYLERLEEQLGASTS
jgi:hypothetical protein